MQAARVALQDEFDQMVTELEISQSSVVSLEARVGGEGERREQELARCADVIQDLQKQLESAEAQWNTARQEVSGLHHYDIITISFRPHNDIIVVIDFKFPGDFMFPCQGELVGGSEV